jgi:glutathione synthase/RimK-type ligase-like ATP-grasp enzyme
MRIALVTCEQLPDWEVDDAPLHAALAARGVEVVHPPWSLPFDWSSVDAALLRTPWDYQARRDAFVAWADAVATHTRLFNGADVVRWNTDKIYLRALAELGGPLAPSVWVAPGSAPDLAAILDAQGWGRAFLKPWVGATASDTLRFRREEVADAQRFLDDCLRRVGMVVQPYLAAVETEGELSVIVIDGEPTHAVRKVPVPGDYRVQDDFDATDHPIPLDDELAALAEAALAGAARLLDGADLLYARVDALRLADGRLVLNELEIVEPSLFFRHGPHAADKLAEALLRRCT